MNKKVASEIVKAGFRSLALKYHPDQGGTHEAMLVLKDTYEALAKWVETGVKPEQARGSTTDSKAGQRQGTWSGRYSSGYGERQRANWSDDFRDKAKGANAGSGPQCFKYKRGWVLIKDVTCVGQSPKAIQVMFPGNPTPAWLPLSQVSAESEVKKEDDRGNLIISDWIAAQKGWSAV